MAASDGPAGDDLEAAAASYADLLAAAAPDGEAVPRFDVLLLGMGPEGHTASMFPDSPAVHELERTVVGVTECPKPPPTRISLTRPAIASADEVWLVAAGEGKAEAVERAVRGAAPTHSRRLGGGPPSQPVADRPRSGEPTQPLRHKRAASARQGPRGNVHSVGGAPTRRAAGGPDAQRERGRGGTGTRRDRPGATAGRTARPPIGSRRRSSCAVSGRSGASPRVGSPVPRPAAAVPRIPRPRVG